MTYIDEVLVYSPRHFWPMAELGGGILRDIGSESKALRQTNLALPWVTGWSGPDDTVGSVQSPGAQAWSTILTDQFFPYPYEFDLWLFLYSDEALGGIPMLNEAAAKGVEVGLDSANHATFAEKGTSATTTLSTSTPLTPFAWHMLTGHDDGFNMQWFLDGVVQASGAPPARGTISAPLSLAGYLGGAVAATPCFIGPVAIYPAETSDGDILHRYDAALTKATYPISRSSPVPIDPTLIADVAAIRSAVRRVYS